MKSSKKNKGYVKDFENETKRLREATDFLRNRIASRNLKENPVEYFLIIWSLLEQVLLPDLIKSIAHRLSLKEFPNLDKKRFSDLINTYYFLSHDDVIYKKLLTTNNRRNKLIHDLFKGNPKKVDKEALNIIMYLIDLIEQVIDRSSGKVIVPVLTLYSKGWEDMKLNITNKLRQAKDEIEKDLK